MPSHISLQPILVLTAGKLPSSLKSITEACGAATLFSTQARLKHSCSLLAHQLHYLKRWLINCCLYKKPSAHVIFLTFHTLTNGSWHLHTGSAWTQWVTVTGYGFCFAPVTTQVLMSQLFSKQLSFKTTVIQNNYFQNNCFQTTSFPGGSFGQGKVEQLFAMNCHKIKRPLYALGNNCCGNCCLLAMKLGQTARTAFW